VKRVLDLLDVLNRPLMDPEQYLIADELRVLDVSRSRKRLGWTPQFRDEDMLMAAYDEYRVARSPDAVFSVGRSESRVSPTARGA
jgi:dTDP-glucose 4,6-dehydratase